MRPENQTPDCLITDISSVRQRNATVLSQQLSEIIYLLAIGDNFRWVATACDVVVALVAL